MAASIAISGASGYLGSRLCRLFLEEGHEVVGLKRLGSDLGRLAGLESRIRLRDVDGEDDPLTGIPAPQLVIHAATQYGRPHETSLEVHEANLHFPMRLIESAARRGVASFVNVDTVLPPSANDYARSKRAFRDEGRARCAMGGPAFVNVVTGNMYGPWDHGAKFPAHVIRSCARNVPELPLTGGEQERDFLYIDDATSAFAAIVKRALEEPASVEFELGTGEGTSVRHFAETVRRLSGSSTRLAFGALPYTGGRSLEARHGSRGAALAGMGAARGTGRRNPFDPRGRGGAMKLLVTGGCGFVGSNLAAAGLQRGWRVGVFDNLQRKGATENLEWLRSRGPVRFTRGDIRSAGEVESVVRDTEPDVVFHLAGQVAMTTSVANPRMDFEVNALGTLNLLEALRHGAPHAALVYASTNKVYGDLAQFSYRELATRYACVERPDGFDEGTPLEFHSPYGCSKGAADQYVLDFARMFGMRTAVFRHSTIYGGRQFATEDQGWIGWFCAKALEARASGGRGTVSISGSGKQVRDILHVDDAVALYFAAAQAMDSIAGHAFNVGGGIDKSLSLLELFDFLSGRLGIELDVQRGPARARDQPVFVADISKAARMIGWRPGIGCAEGIDAMLAWTQGRS